MRMITCKIHGEEEAIMQDPVLLKYVCKKCKQALQKLRFTKVKFKSDFRE